MGHPKNIVNISAESADRLGEIAAEIKVLTDERKYHEVVVKNCGHDVVEGKKFCATVSRYERVTIDWKKICERIGVSKYFIKTYRKVASVVKVNVTAHKKSKK